ncbi:MAG: polysaccharide pyruvyl transferase family protein [Phycisphaerae bacterium]|nr:polysaccharide pyruvyl transferase family protein [Phycisphaerae bacterium]
MKIGILTFHSVANFGANIQSSSSFMKLKSLGHDVCMLNYRDSLSEKKHRQMAGEEQYALHLDYCKTYVRQSPILRNNDDVCDYVKQWKPDLIVCGGDAVLLHEPNGTPDRQCGNPFWLTWMKDIPEPPPACYLSASSRGSYFSRIPENLRKDVADRFKRIKYFSTRDHWTTRQVQWITGGKQCPFHCPDPAFAFELDVPIPQEYCATAVSRKQSYILLQANPRNLSKRWVAEFRQLAHQQGLEVYSFPTTFGNSECDLDEIISLPLHPLEWYSWIQNAAGCITRLFHGQICAMAAGVPFINIDTQQRYPWLSRSKSRAHDLAVRADCGGRVIPTISARYLMSPRKAMKLLQHSYRPTIMAYAECARDLYSRAINRMLDSVK